MRVNKQILERLMSELELALESDRGAATAFKGQVHRALERARSSLVRPESEPLKIDRLVN